MPKVPTPFGLSSIYLIVFVCPVWGYAGLDFGCEVGEGRYYIALVLVTPDSD
ncbi:MAG: hypothetical protein OXE41_02230 [Gammaproteobacteria bacterium]|nr:hypothetical protein [Gammaproteobacteria bacterium]